MGASWESLLQGLNREQREAVEAVGGPVLVVAGPGTGKTRTLTVRLAYLMQRVPPQALLAVTFTNRAAREMGKRLAALAGEPAAQVSLGTFHSFCLQLLRAEGRRLGLPSGFGVCDPSDQTAILRECLERLPRPGEAQRLLQDLSQARNRTLDWERALGEIGLLELYQAYRERLRRLGLLDFDDLQTLALTLLESFPELQERLQERYRYLSVDEYQDVNPLQRRCLRLLGGEAPNLWAVGDADQAIYAFRGAQVESFLGFERDFTGARVIRLEQSYRSTPEIVAAATQVIRRNRNRLPSALRTDNPPGPLIHNVSLPDEEAEAAWIVGEIEERVGGTSHYQHDRGKIGDPIGQRQRSFRDFAVLYRLNALAKPLEEAFARSGIPYRVVGATRFFDRKAVKDVLAYLRVLRSPEDSGSLKRIVNTPPRGIGRETQAALEAQANERGAALFQVLQENPFSQNRSIQDFLRLLQGLGKEMAGHALSRFIAWLLEETGLKGWHLKQDARRENEFLLLLSLAAQHDDLPLPEALERFLAEAALTTESDDYDGSADAVTLMTLHSAKGLEFTEVFLCGLEEDILPCVGVDPEEERRLFYVGLTRARERVHLLACRSRFLFGERRQRPVSRFLTEFDDTLKEMLTVPDLIRRSKADEPQQLSLL